MAMIPLPSVVPDKPVEGYILGAEKAKNALLKQRLENQYYGKNIESEMANRNALTRGQDITNQYLPEKLKQANAFAGLENKWYEPKAQSQIANQNALTNKYNTMTPLEARELSLKNQAFPERNKAEIEQMKALAKYREMGGGGMGTGSKEEFMFQNLIAQDNPQLKTREQIYEASNALRRGENQLSDGTPLNPISPAAKQSLDRLVRGTTTASLITQGTKANQAEAELGVLNDYAQKGLEPYGDTFAGYSPQQIVDTFKKDDASQKKLGQFIASQALQYEAAQNRIRLANGQPGVTSTEELMKLSGQMIKTRYPQLTYKARKEAADYLDKALKEGLNARKKVGFSASDVNKQSTGASENKHWVYNPQTGQLE